MEGAHRQHSGDCRLTHDPLPGSQVLQGEGFRMRVSLHGTYLRAHVFEGIDSVPVSIAMWKMAAEQCRLHRMRQLLLVEDLADTVELADVGDVVAAMASFGLADCRMAFVEVQDDIQGSEHGEILAMELGIIVRVFGEESEARQWLLYGSGS